MLFSFRQLKTLEDRRRSSLMLAGITVRFVLPALLQIPCEPVANNGF